MARVRRGVLWARRGCTADVRTALKACPEGLTVSQIAKMTDRRYPVHNIGSVLGKMRRRGESNCFDGLWVLVELPNISAEKPIGK